MPAAISCMSSRPARQERAHISVLRPLSTANFFFFKQKTAYDVSTCLKFRRVLFRSKSSTEAGIIEHLCQRLRQPPGVADLDRKSVVKGKSVDLGGGRLTKKKK